MIFRDNNGQTLYSKESFEISCRPTRNHDPTQNYISLTYSVYDRDLAVLGIQSAKSIFVSLLMPYPGGPTHMAITSRRHNNWYRVIKLASAAK